MKAGSIEFSGHAIACLIRNHLSIAGSVIIDGEIVVPAADGTTDFSVLQNELRGKQPTCHDRFRSALPQRPGSAKTAADRAQGACDIADRENGDPIQRSFKIDGKEMFAHACKVGLEGVVSKLRDSRYLSGRGRERPRRKRAIFPNLVTRNIRRGARKPC